MRKIVFTMLLLIIFAYPSFAILHIGVSGGYSYSSMEDLNNYWKTAKEASDNTGTAATISSFGNSIFINLDADFSTMPVLQFGPRLGFQYVFPAEYKGAEQIVPTVWVNIDTKTDAYLFPIMFGANMNFGIPAMPFSLTAAAYGGWGIAYLAEDTTYNGSPPFTTLYNGGGLMADLSAAFEFKVLPFINLSINTGYRFADISSMKVVKNVTIPIPNNNITINTNNPLSDSSGKQISVNC